MEKVDIAICDDEAFALNIMKEAIKKVLEQNQIQGEIRLFSSIKALEKRMEEAAYDLLLLDIDIPVTNGIDFAKKLRQQNNMVDIIFVSSREDKVFDSLRVNPYGFVRKSYFLEDISEVLGAYLKQRGKIREHMVVLQVRDTTVSVCIRDILYIEGAKKQQEIYVVGYDEPLVVKSSMQELEEEFNEFGFIRIHKGYLINYKHFRAFNELEVVLDNGYSLPMSRRRVNEVKSRYMELMKKEGSIVF